MSAITNSPTPEEVTAAEDFLRSCGFQVLDRNWHCPHDRLDIVAVDRGTLVAVVIRRRPRTGGGPPLAVITNSRRRSLRNMAVAWMTIHAHSYERIRIDILGVTPVGADRYSVECAREVG